MATILIVDDEADILFLLRMMLENAGYSVLEAGNGADAMEQLERAHPDLVITDLMMPVMDGQELIHRMQEREEMRQVPIILVSANPNGATGSQAFLRKPFRHEELIGSVRSLLGEAV